MAGPFPFLAGPLPFFAPLLPGGGADLDYFFFYVSVVCAELNGLVFLIFESLVFLGAEADGFFTGAFPAFFGGAFFGPLPAFFGGAFGPLPAFVGGFLGGPFASFALAGFTGADYLASTVVEVFKSANKASVFANFMWFIPIRFK